MKRILLINPPLLERIYPGAPSALFYLAAALLKYKHQVTIIDLNTLAEIEHYLKLKQLILNFKPNLIGITVMSVQADSAHKLTKYIKGFDPNQIVIVGGHHETHSWKYTLEAHPDIDACVIGDGEETIVEIAQAVENCRIINPQSIKGLAYYDQKLKAPVSTGIRFAQNLDDFLPARLFHHDSYDFKIFGLKKTAQVMTARGCPYACSYCNEATHAYRRKLRLRTLESLRQEFILLKDQGYQAIYFDDSTFTADQKRACAIAKLVKEYGFSWGCHTRVDALDQKTIEVFKSSGCVYLFCGVESFSQSILRGVNKTRHPRRYLRLAKNVYHWLRVAELPCSVFLIFGGPRRETNGTVKPETDEDVILSLKAAIGLDPDYLSLNIMRLLPGCPVSFGSNYFCLRPEGKIINGGDYDSVWLKQNKGTDYRSYHPVYRGFEGTGSVNPPQMNPEKCYWILGQAVSLINGHNSTQFHQIKLVVEPTFEVNLGQQKIQGKILYKLTPFSQLI